jgi:outer membrane protein assembly factor BamD
MGKTAFSFPLVCLALCAWLNSGCTSTGEKLDANSAEGAFAIAERLDKDDRYEEALIKFAEVKNKHSYSRLATEAELRIADLHFRREAYIEAQGAYQLFKEFHPRHPRLDYVTFRLAMSHFHQLPSTVDRDLSSADRALLYFDEVISSFPKSEFVTEAIARRQETLKMQAEKELSIADFYFRRDVFDSALGRYEHLLKNFKGLGFDAQALLGAALSASRSGERDRALKHAQALISQFPQSSQATQVRSELKITQ